MAHFRVICMIRSKLLSWYSSLPKEEARSYKTGFLSFDEHLSRIADIDEGRRVNITDIIYSWAYHAYKAEDKMPGKIQSFEAVKPYLPITRDQDASYEYQAAIESTIERCQHLSSSKGMSMAISRLRLYGGRFATIIVSVASEELLLLSKSGDCDQDSLRIAKYVFDCFEKAMAEQKKQMEQVV
ncbi:hypothetical protein [Aeromonas media]|uniref:hypothetical protein n=1 Tax=Aeromonas media TaxID=651 RepID=UPI003D1C6F27